LLLLGLVSFSERLCRPVQIGSSFFLSSSPIPILSNRARIVWVNFSLMSCSWSLSVSPSTKVNARKSAVFLVPRTCHPSFPLVANSAAIGTASIFYNERKSILRMGSDTGARPLLPHRSEGAYAIFVLLFDPTDPPFCSLHLVNDKFMSLLQVNAYHPQVRSE